MSERGANGETEPAAADAGDPADRLLAELVDDFLRRHRSGDRPSPEEYSRRYPALAEPIRELFPALIAMEQPALCGAPDLAPPGERAGATIGRYKLLERL